MCDLPMHYLVVTLQNEENSKDLSSLWTTNYVFTLAPLSKQSRIDGARRLLMKNTKLTKHSMINYSNNKNVLKNWLKMYPSLSLHAPTKISL